MCGIIYFHNHSAKSVADSVLKRFAKQKSRGVEGFGLLGFDLEKRDVGQYWRCEHEQTMKDVLDGKIIPNGTSGEPNNAMLFHHRYPTSTPNLAECAHPIVVANDKLDYMYVGVHNGVIRNEDELRVAHEKEGFTYTTLLKEKKVYEIGGKEREVSITEVFNDSESLLIELAQVIDGKKKTCDAYGTIAFIIAQIDKEEKIRRLYFGRNSGNPLHLEHTKDILSLTSVGDGELVEENKLMCYDYETKEITSQDLVIKSYERDTGYDYRKKDDQTSLPSPYQNNRLGFRTDDHDFLEDDGYNLTRKGGRSFTDYDAYVKQLSMTDYPIEQWIKEMNTDVDTLLDNVYDEISLVNTLIQEEVEWGGTSKQATERMEFLEGRSVDLDIMAQDLEEMEGMMDGALEKEEEETEVMKDGLITTQVIGRGEK